MGHRKHCPPCPMPVQIVQPVCPGAVGGIGTCPPGAVGGIGTFPPSMGGAFDPCVAPLAQCAKGLCFDVNFLLIAIVILLFAGGLGGLGGISGLSGALKSLT